MIGSLPGAYPADALGPDPHDESGRRVVHRREPHIRPQIYMRQSLEEFGCASLLDPCPTVDDQIMGEPVFVAASRLEREHDPGLAPHVVELLLGIAQVPGDDVLAVETDPNDRDLRRTVGVDGHEVSQMASRERRSGVFVERDHCDSLPRRHSAPMSSDQDQPNRDAFHETCWAAWSAVRAVGSSDMVVNTSGIGIPALEHAEEQRMLDDHTRRGPATRMGRRGRALSLITEAGECPAQ